MMLVMFFNKARNFKIFDKKSIWKAQGNTWIVNINY
jgi:hypothetical protein